MTGARERVEGSEADTLNRFASCGEYSASEEAIFRSAANEINTLLAENAVLRGALEKLAADLKAEIALLDSQCDAKVNDEDQSAHEFLSGRCNAKIEISERLGLFLRGAEPTILSHQESVDRYIERRARAVLKGEL